MKYLVANWKQFKTGSEVDSWVKAVSSANVVIAEDLLVYVAAPFVYLPYLATQKSELFKLAAQNISPKKEGAYTGEVGALQVAEYAQAVIVGHSERRMYFGETNQFVSLKVAEALDAGLKVFVCIADRVFEDGRVPREKVETQKEWFDTQLTSVFEKVSEKDRGNIVLVYEPISAISTFGGVPLTGDQAVEQIKTIKSVVGSDIEVMYGGSVNPSNFSEYWQHEDVAGAMPGNASLDPQSFLNMLRQTAV